MYDFLSKSFVVLTLCQPLSCTRLDRQHNRTFHCIPAFINHMEHVQWRSVKESCTDINRVRLAGRKRGSSGRWRPAWRAEAAPSSRAGGRAAHHSRGARRRTVSSSAQYRISLSLCFCMSELPPLWLLSVGINTPHVVCE